MTARTELLCSNYQPIAFIDWESGDINLTTRHESTNAVTADEYAGFSRTVVLPELVNAEALQARIDAGEFKPMTDRVIEGLEESYSSGNRRASFSEDAEEAQNELIELLESAAVLDGEFAGLWEAAAHLQYSDDVSNITAQTTDAEISKMAKTIYAEALEQDAVVEGIEEYLTDVRNQKIAEAETIAV